MKSHLKSLRKNQSALPWILFIFIMTFFFLLFGIGTSSLAAQNLGPDHLKNIIDLQSISLKKINSSIYLGWKWDFRRDLFRFQTLIIVEKCSLKINNKKIMNELMIRPLPSFLPPPPSMCRFSTFETKLTASTRNRWKITFWYLPHVKNHMTHVACSSF